MERTFRIKPNQSFYTSTKSVMLTILFHVFLNSDQQKQTDHTQKKTCSLFVIILSMGILCKRQYRSEKSSRNLLNVISLKLPERWMVKWCL